MKETCKVCQGTGQGRKINHLSQSRGQEYEITGCPACGGEGLISYAPKNAFLDDNGDVRECETRG